MTSRPEIDLLLQQYWRARDNREDLTYDLLAHVTAAPPTDAVTAGRCAAILATLPNPQGRWAERIAEFNTLVAHLVRRQHQVDALGDDNSDPEVVFEILDDEITDLDMNAFDPAALRNARIGKPTRAAAARAFLDTFGWDNLIPDAASELRTTLDNLDARAAQYNSTALFTDPTGSGVALGVQVRPATTGTVNGDGVFGPPRDRDEALRVLRAAVAAGVDHIDTAQYYGRAR